jgi:hypothetical protein
VSKKIEFSRSLNDSSAFKIQEAIPGKFNLSLGEEVIPAEANQSIPKAEFLPFKQLVHSDKLELIFPADK